MSIYYMSEVFEHFIVFTRKIVSDKITQESVFFEIAIIHGIKKIAIQKYVWKQSTAF